MYDSRSIGDTNMNPVEDIEMNFMKMIILLIVVAIFLLGVVTGCSKKEDNKRSDWLKKFAKERENLAARAKHNKDFTDKQLAIVDKCFEKQCSCLDKCECESCEDKCLRELSICEKDLPLELKAIK